jgi:hypothetical protein
MTWQETLTYTYWQEQTGAKICPWHFQTHWPTLQHVTAFLEEKLVSENIIYLVNTLYSLNHHHTYNILQ